MNDLAPRGPEILPGTWEYEWVADMVHAVEQRSGRPSHWNGKLHEEPGPRGGLMHHDGTMTINRPIVLDAARAGYTADRRLTPEEAGATGRATFMAVHMARLSLSSPGDESLPGASPVTSLENVALEQARRVSYQSLSAFR